MFVRQAVYVLDIHRAIFGPPVPSSRPWPAVGNKRIIVTVARLIGFYFSFTDRYPPAVAVAKTSHRAVLYVGHAGVKIYVADNSAAHHRCYNVARLMNRNI